MSYIPGWVYLLILFCVALVIIIGLVLNYKLVHVLLVSLFVGAVGLAVLTLVYMPTDAIENITTANQDKTTNDRIITLPDGTTYELPATPTPVPQTVQEIGEDAMKKIDKMYDEFNKADVAEIMDEGFTPEELQQKMSELTGLDISIEEAQSLYELLQMTGLFNEKEN